MSVIEIQCKTARDFVTELDPSHDQWAGEHWRQDWIFRGQANSNWRLIPTAFRTETENVSEQIKIARTFGRSKVLTAPDFLQDTYTKVNNYDANNVYELLIQIYAEIGNLREFFELADSVNLNSSLPIPSEYHIFGTKFAKTYVENLDNTKNMLDIWGIAPIAIAQHHGVATRLLDWTKNPLYAAFFAAEGVDAASTHIAVYAVHTFHLRHEIRLIEVSKGHSPYIHSQEGVFTLDTKADIEFLKNGQWRSFPDSVVGEVCKFTLPVAEVRELLRLLWLKRVTKAHMMPALDNVILALNTKWKWQRDNLAKPK